MRKPERIAPCRLRSLRETLTHRGGRGATAYPPRGGLATQRRLSDCKHWGVGAPGGTRTPGIRLRSPSALPVFSASCGTGGTFEGTNRLLETGLVSSVDLRRRDPRVAQKPPPRTKRGMRAAPLPDVPIEFGRHGGMDPRHFGVSGHLSGVTENATGSLSVGLASCSPQARP